MPMTAKRARARAGAVIAACALMLPAGCGGGSDVAAVASGAATAGATATPAARDLSSYDVYVQGNAENNPLFQDVYGIRFNPFTVDRITTDKRISWLAADGARVMVAAGDEDIDKLGQLTGSGEVLPIPGLGRPHAYSPALLDGVMYYDDAQGDESAGENRYFAWNLAKRTKTLLFSSKADLGPGLPAAGGRLVLGGPGKPGHSETVIRSKTGKLTRFDLKTDAGNSFVGRDLIAVNTLETVSGKEDVDGFVLLDPSTGNVKRVAGYQILCWSPDGLRLLARRSGDAKKTQLVLLDPSHPDAPTELHDIPGLVLFGASWVRGAPAVDQAG
ncbi:MAG TPA: hypothetical protein VGJ14_07535 [Sporichthyaceae bacterium]|jgi:hypothetical protein